MPSLSQYPAFITLKIELAAEPSLPPPETFFIVPENARTLAGRRVRVAYPGMIPDTVVMVVLMLGAGGYVITRSIPATENPTLALALALLVLIGMMVVIGAVITGTEVRKRRAELRDGQIVPGKIVQCRRIPDLLMLTADYGVEYAFTSPQTGRTITNGAWHKIPRCEHPSNPVRGAPVAILYVDDLTYALL